MKKFFAKAALAATALVLCGTANAVTNTLVFQGVTWTTTSIDSNTMTLRIQGALSSATPDWSNITHLWTLGINPVGTVTTATITPPGTFSGNELNANGCAGGLSGKACFTFSPMLNLTDDMLFTVDFTGTGLDMEAVFHVKVGFVCATEGATITPSATTEKCGSLMSMDIFTSSGSTGARRAPRAPLARRARLGRRATCRNRHRR